jgi:hypothetical protein
LVFDYRSLTFYGAGFHPLHLTNSLPHRGPTTPQASFSAPRDDTARASCGNGAKANSYHLNPFGTKSLDKDAPETPTLIPAGERIRLRHRFVFHRGDEVQAGIAGLYDAYSSESH